MTAHSPCWNVSRRIGVIPEQNKITFANNDINFKDKTGINHDKFSFGLKNRYSIICMECSVLITIYKIGSISKFQNKIPSDFIYNCLEKEQNFNKTKCKNRLLGGNLKPKSLPNQKKEILGK